MIKLLLTLMLIFAALQAGLSLSEVQNFHSRQCMRALEKASRDVLKIKWRPISVFPDEAQRFR